MKDAGTMLSMTPDEKKTIDTMRALAMDAVQAAKSGHPGTPVALSPITYLLYNERMKYDPNRPNWPGRDRFVLSIGHASTLIYSTLHVARVKSLDADGKPTERPAVAMDDLKSFRQLGSRCAGHPEYGRVEGVEMTTGPLGAGVATSVGFAMANNWLASRYNKPNFKLFDANVYALCGDGCMMEGISSEAASLAGHLKLSNLCWIYDSNRITIEGDTDLAFTESVPERFAAYGWNVLHVDDVNDLPALRQAFDAFEAEQDRPTLIVVKSVIAYGAPTKAGKESAHGAPLGDDEIAGAKKFYGMDPDVKFACDDDVYAQFANNLGKRGPELSAAWDASFEKYRAEFPDLAKELDAIFAGKLPEGWDKPLEAFPADEKGMASRASSGKVLNQLAAGLPWLVGGSADLAPSNNTWLKDEVAGEFGPKQVGRNIHVGVRENAMGAIANGLVLSGLRGYCATFFVFADYLRPMIRLAALMEIPTLFVFTHDSIGVGEDGPTHQPIEHLASLRAIPNVAVFRPADANEVSEAYKAAMNLTKTPSVMVLTRQNLPTVDRTKYAAAAGVAKGAYVLADCDGTPDAILIGTGSEVGLCLKAADALAAEGVKARVVSAPCLDIFAKQSAEYRKSVLPKNVKARVGVELGVELGWGKLIGDCGKFLGMTTFGDSAPAAKLMEHFGFTVDRVVALAKESINEAR
ncbi:MAG: transketolase [Thermoguttaceae bacterium]|nr:transketolase [Thermoguttaceae bacterium]